jgi:acyl-CoA thioesterase I
VTENNLSAIVSTLRNAGSKVILAGITLPPNYGPDYIRQFNGIFREVATEYHVALLPMLYAHLYTVPGAIQEDGVHPTSKGAQLLARNILPLLIPLLRKI